MDPSVQLTEFLRHGVQHLHVVHQDIVYAKGCPISMRKLVLEYKDSVEDVIIDSEYVVF